MPKSLFVQEHTPSLAELIDQGSRLWHEEARRRSGKALTRLWKIAGARMSAKAAPSGISSLQLQGTSRDQNSCFSAWDAQLLIFGGSLVPAGWDGCDSVEPYPHQGLFASAFFFHQATKLLVEKNVSAAWASLTQAYHYLEMNAPVLTASESGKAAADTRHARNKNDLQATVLDILSTLQRDPSIRSGAEARRRVVDAFRRNKKYLKILDEYDRIYPKKTRGNTALGRLHDRLADWSEPGGSCPDVEKAIRPFKQKRRNRSVR